MAKSYSRCKRCERILTNRNSIVRGYGNYCYQIVMGFATSNHKDITAKPQSTSKSRSLLEIYGDNVHNILQRRLEEYPEFTNTVENLDRIHKVAKGQKNE